jgi:Domain of unknown function (DUF4338)/Transposase Tn5 dimerisation domain/Transposase DNA-binding
MKLILQKIGQKERAENKAWEEMMDEYHYLGSTGLIGAEIRYFIRVDDEIVGGINFSSPAMRCRARDRWIGWDETTRKERLQEIINNARFLLIGSKTLPNLASQVLSLSSKQVPRDWEARYKIQPKLMETFVDDRFDGASYKASNWIYVGDTIGRGRRDQKHEKKLSIKGVYVYPLASNSTQRLGGHAHAPKIVSCWVTEELKRLKVSDKRLKARGIQIAKDFYKNPTANIPEACETNTKTVGAYRFFRHQDVTLSSMIASHTKATVKRIRKESVILAVQDTTSLNYTRRASDEFGHIGSNHATGMLVHGTMAFTPEGLPLGLLNVQTWVRKKEETGKRHLRAQKTIDEKESNKWLVSYQSLVDIQPQLPDTMLVSVGDREADIYDLFERASQTENGPELVIRARHDRCCQDKKLLWTLLEESPSSGQITLSVPRKPGQKKREAILDLRYKQVTIKKKESSKTHSLWAIYAHESNPPATITPISWMLLTTLPITSFEDALEKLKWYTVRWQIEVYHKIIKSGCRIEDRQLANLKSISACLALDMIVAWRVFFMTIYPRLYPQHPCSVGFSDEEWQALYLIQNHTHTLPKQPPSIRDMVRMVASKGGFLCRKSDGEPGPITIWRGLIHLTALVEGFIFFAKEQPPPGQLIYV